VQAASPRRFPVETRVRFGAPVLDARDLGARGDAVTEALRRRTYALA
jgi:hypothetical protein